MVWFKWSFRRWIISKGFFRLSVMWKGRVGGLRVLLCLCDQTFPGRQQYEWVWVFATSENTKFWMLLTIDQVLFLSNSDRRRCFYFLFSPMQKRNHKGKVRKMLTTCDKVGGLRERPEAERRRNRLHTYGHCWAYLSLCASAKAYMESHWWIHIRNLPSESPVPSTGSVASVAVSPSDTNSSVSSYLNIQNNKNNISDEQQHLILLQDAWVG